MSTDLITDSVVIPELSDPVQSANIIWPHYTLYKQQREIMYSVRDNFETVVPAGNDLGKDFITGMIAVWFFVSRRPARIVTTSVDGSQLRNVLWGEIRKFLQEAAIPLPVEYTDLHLHQVNNLNERIPKSECIGRVAQKGEGMLGMHAAWTPKNEPTTLFIIDEASGVGDEAYEKADTWAHRILIIGNPYKCENFFFKGSKEGDRKSARADSGQEKLARKVIRIKAIDSPNVQKGLNEVKAGKKPSYKDIIPGLLGYAEYLRRLDMWDEHRQCIGLNAEFYEGASVKLFPPYWLDLAENLFDAAHKGMKRKALAIGIDPAEGKDSTCFAAVDQYGLIALKSQKTPDTSKVMGLTLAFMRKHGMDPKNVKHCGNVCFDRGGGGKQHADYARSKGYKFRTVAFGGSVTPEIKHGTTTTEDRKKEREQQYAYFNKRAEMAGRLSLLLDPEHDGMFSLPPDEFELRKQLSVIPREYDNEGRLKLPPKRNKPGSTEPSLIKLIGHSPDEMDAVMLAVYGMQVKPDIQIVGTAW